MTTDSLLSICQQYNEAWVSNGTHACHYRQQYVDTKYKIDRKGGFVCSANNDSALRELTKKHDINIWEGWFLVAHT